MEESMYKHHFELLDRYQQFSSEVLRLSLAIVAALGFFLGLAHGEGARVAQSMSLSVEPRRLIEASLVALAGSVAAALMHRYVSSDALFYILLRNTRRLTRRERAAMRMQFKLSTWTILIAPAALALGVLLFAAAFLLAW